MWKSGSSGTPESVVFWDHMKSVIAIANQKGGVGKTTTAAALGVVLSRAGERVHLVDMDAQANLTTTFGQRDNDGILYRSLKEGGPLPVVELTENLSLSRSSTHLARGESEFVSQPAQQFILQNALEATELPDETIVILDSAPSLGVLSVNCLTAADKLIVAVHAAQWAIEALVRLQETVNVIQQRINPRLEVLGVVMTLCDRRERITKVVREQLRRRYRLLGLVRGETALKYATGEGRLLELRNSYALDEYAAVGKEVQKMLWAKQTSAA